MVRHLGHKSTETLFPQYKHQTSRSFSIKSNSFCSFTEMQNTWCSWFLPLHLVMSFPPPSALKWPVHEPLLTFYPSLPTCSHTSSCFSNM